MPQMFGTITVSDGISMGTEGMKYSLVSREVIADSIETACNGQSMDALLAIGGCDKNMPGTIMAACRLDRPALMVYGGTIKPGKDRVGDPLDKNTDVGAINSKEQLEKITELVAAGDRLEEEGGAEGA